MRKKATIVLLLALISAAPVYACTSFAVYSKDGPIFGMNWDLPTRTETNYSSIGYFEDLNPKIMITSRPGVKTFGLGSNAFSINPFYNEFGVFGAAQAIYPPVFVPHLTDAIMSLGLVMLAGIHARSAQDMVNQSQDAKLFYLSPAGEMEIISHWLFADTRGEAVIIEPGVEENYFLHMSEEKYIVMANFLNHKLDSAPRIIVSLDFDRRYRIVDQMISPSVSNFSLDHALATLEAAKQSITKFSFVVVSEEENVYMAVLGDFFRIWRIDLAEKTITTFKGFTENRIESLGEVGLSLEELLEWK
mgnify:FL=1|jgi:hypothetical protein